MQNTMLMDQKNIKNNQGTNQVKLLGPLQLIKALRCPFAAK